MGGRRSPFKPLKVADTMAGVRRLPSSNPLKTCRQSKDAGAAIWRGRWQCRRDGRSTSDGSLASSNRWPAGGERWRKTSAPAHPVSRQYCEPAPLAGPRPPLPRLVQPRTPRRTPQRRRRWGPKKRAGLRACYQPDRRRWPRRFPCRPAPQRRARSGCFQPDFWAWTRR